MNENVVLHNFKYTLEDIDNQTPNNVADDELFLKINMEVE